MHVETGFSLLSDHDLYLFNEGTWARAYERLGAHPVRHDGSEGTYFAVWAPNARTISVVGDFNDWRPGEHILQFRGTSGIAEGFIPDIGPGTRYKYYIESHHHGYRVAKADPYGFGTEMPPATASVVADMNYSWGDDEWMRNRAGANRLSSPISVYEVHLGSWRRKQGHQWLSYREMAEQLVPYVKDNGFTHVELMPVMEHPFFGSWGYQVTAYFAPTARFGSPRDLMYLIDQFHQNGIGVILDWVPSHFPSDEHGLAYFDGTHLYEHADRRLGYHPDWNSYIFNYGRSEVQTFLLSSALFWLDKYHVDGLRVDAVASMLYRDYSRKEGEWIPNQYGGKENIEAIEFLRKFNAHVYREFPDTQTIAEESTAWPMVSRPTYIGGLGFGCKWDMGWMHDTLAYMQQDPFFRKYHHDKLTFRMLYAFGENFMLPLSHDEVVHGKGSLIGRMPGTSDQKFAGLRALLAYMWAQPGKKLLFMGGEIGQWMEWNHEGSLDWALLDFEQHAKIRLLVGALNWLYRSEAALHRCDHDPGGFEWIDVHDGEKNMISFLRKTLPGDEMIAMVFNFSPVVRTNYRIGAPKRGFWRELLNTDAQEFGGAGHGNFGGAETVPIPLHGRPYSLTLTIPPLGAVYLKWEGERQPG
jgi:1,4-alpha-glucan branching enzyme